jgi:hypothetical protein
MADGRSRPSPILRERKNVSPESPEAVEAMEAADPLVWAPGDVLGRPALLLSPLLPEPLKYF